MREFSIDADQHGFGRMLELHFDGDDVQDLAAWLGRANGEAGTADAELAEGAELGQERATALV